MGGKLIGCGRIGRAVGLKGECAVLWNNGVSPVDVDGNLILEDPKDGSKARYTIAALRKQGRLNFVSFKGVEDRSAAARLTNREVLIEEERLKNLPKGQYYCYQILGMDVETEGGRNLGKVVRIFTAGEHDVYEVLGEGGRSGEEILVPAIDSVVLKIDVKKKKMVVRPLEGMLE